MFSQTVLIAILAAVAEARFGQEQTPIQAISAVTSGGQSGQAATLAGQSISFLLAAANPCAKLTQGDLILEQLGTGADAVAAARGLVGAEQNFNPFVVSIPSICSDPTLPKNELLRGVTPLIDPAVGGSDAANALAKTSLTTPFDATGLSVAQVLAAQGFTNFTTKDTAGTVGTAPAGGAAAPVVVADPVAADPAAPAVTSAAEAAAPAATSCVATSFVTVTRGAEATAAAPEPAAATSAPATAAPATGGSATKSSLGLDFGTCVPTMDFVLGRPGRKATEGTFLPIDPAVKAGQQEALNPNIITNRICDQLTNVCNAAADAKAACLAAKATISALGTKDATTATAWNSALGF